MLTKLGAYKLLRCKVSAKYEQWQLKLLDDFCFTAQERFALRECILIKINPPSQRVY